MIINNNNTNNDSNNKNNSNMITTMIIMIIRIIKTIRIVLIEIIMMIRRGKSIIINEKQKERYRLKWVFGRGNNCQKNIKIFGKRS